MPPTDDLGPLALIVEDNPVNMTLTRAVLKRAGYRTEEASSAEQAIQRLREVKPELILMDLQLPGEDGLSLTQRLKADPATAHIAIIALTAYAMKHDRALAEAAGCDGYISKPLNTRTFSGEVAAILNSRRPSWSAPGPPAT